MGKRVAVPTAFYTDHMERDLPTPAQVGTRSGRVLIDADDPAVADLCDDARHYAGRNNTDAPAWLRRSAAATLTALGC